MKGSPMEENFSLWGSLCMLFDEAVGDYRYSGSWLNFMLLEPLMSK
jgi:hypothetical protein